MAVGIIIKPTDTDFYADAVFLSARKEHGAIIVDGEQIASSLQCSHCGSHWVEKRGSGRKRGFCQTCMGPLCGDAPCMQPCLVGAELAFERQLDLYEKAMRIAGV